MSCSDFLDNDLADQNAYAKEVLDERGADLEGREMVLTAFLVELNSWCQEPGNENRAIREILD